MVGDLFINLAFEDFRKAGLGLRSKSGILASTEEYKFVEQLISPSRVPFPPKHDGPSPFGWNPPSEVPLALPHMICRSRMHNVPVYTYLTHGSRKTRLKGTSG
uniref:Large ribosomal subunit protein mL49 n=1 Tax=Oncorhynchus mykiss TaxID=8022 RepID=A0A8C7WIE2_ONCMY